MTDSGSTSTQRAMSISAARKKVNGATDSQLLILAEGLDERVRQNTKHGPVPLTRRHGTSKRNKLVADEARTWTDKQARHGCVTWVDILLEEVYEASAEEDWPELRTELVQVMAVALSWLEDGDKKHARYEEIEYLRAGIKGVRVIEQYNEAQAAHQGGTGESRVQEKGREEAPPQEAASDVSRAVRRDQGASGGRVPGLHEGDGRDQGTGCRP